MSRFVGVSPWTTFSTSLGFVGAATCALAALRLRRLKRRHRSNNPEGYHNQCRRDDGLDFDEKNVDMDTAGAPLRVIRKAECVIRARTSRVIMVLERCSNAHNYSAVLRTVEALGVQHVWLIAPTKLDSEFRGDASKDPKKVSVRKRNVWHEDKEKLQRHVAYAKKAYKWLTVREFATTTECIEALRAENREIWCTDLSQAAQVLTETGLEATKDRDAVEGLPSKFALVMGTESTGVSAEFIESCDRRIHLKMRGFADSLNLSVASALVMQHLFYIDPSLACDMTDAERRALRQKWYPRLARNDVQKDAYLALVDNPPAPFTDVRRPDEHRVGWMKKKVRRRMQDAGHRFANVPVKTSGRKW